MKPIKMIKGTVTATIYEENIVFIDSSNGSKRKEKVRRHLPTLEKCIEAHVRCLITRGYEVVE